MTSVGVDLWLHGGRDVMYVGYYSSSDELWRFNTSTDVWESVVTNGEVPSRRYDHVMTSVTTSVGVDLWLHGGRSPNFRERLLGDLWRFNTSTRGWELVLDSPGQVQPFEKFNRPVPTRRCRHVMTSVGQDLWLHGGDTDSGEGDVSHS